MLVTPLSPWLAGHARPIGTKVTLLVLHATAGSDVNGAIETLKLNGLSYHALIAKDGRMFKGLPFSSVAYHAGSSYGPREAERGVSRVQRKDKTFVAGCSVNTYSVGMAFVNRNDGKDPFSAMQTKNGIWLAGQVAIMYPELKWVTSHAIVSPGRKSDPLGYDLDAFAREAGLEVWRP
jgi:N-acetyl-anhydromuramyl-L-alanine amidase AmpD